MSLCLPLICKTSDVVNRYCKAAASQLACATRTTKACARHDLWISRVGAVEPWRLQGVHTPARGTRKVVLAHRVISEGFDLTSELRADAKASGRMREKGIDGRHRLAAGIGTSGTAAVHVSDAFLQD
jgi:hypothetical protein